MIWKHKKAYLPQRERGDYLPRADHLCSSFSQARRSQKVFVTLLLKHWVKESKHESKHNYAEWVTYQFRTPNFHAKYDLEVLSEIPPTLLFAESYSSECGRPFHDELLWSKGLRWEVTQGWPTSFVKDNLRLTRRKHTLNFFIYGYCSHNQAISAHQISMSFLIFPNFFCS